MKRSGVHMSDEAARPRYSIVVPVFNEEAILPLLLHRMDGLLDSLDGPAEAIFVDDGSRDTSGIVLAAKAQQDRRYRYIALARNFGHQVAITAGMDAARGDAVVVMDADLQDPPEVVLQLVEKWKEGYEVVYARRISRAGESRFKRWTAAAFYKVLRWLTSVDVPSNVGDFRLVDRKAVETFRAMPERDRFVRGMFAWMGFRQAAVDFHRDARAIGETKYGFRKMVRLALDAAVGFSDAPLRLALWSGSIVFVIAALFGFYVLGLALHDADLVPGWASIVILVSLLAGMNLLMTGIVGLYVGRIHAEVKQRPLYVVARTVGVGEGSAAGQMTEGPAPLEPLGGQLARKAASK